MQVKYGQPTTDEEWDNATAAHCTSTTVKAEPSKYNEQDYLESAAESMSWVAAGLYLAIFVLPIMGLVIWVFWSFMHIIGYPGY